MPSLQGLSRNRLQSRCTYSCFTNRSPPIPLIARQCACQFNTSMIAFTFLIARRSFPLQLLFLQHQRQQNPCLQKLHHLSLKPKVQPYIQPYKFRDPFNYTETPLPRALSEENPLPSRLFYMILLGTLLYKERSSNYKRRHKFNLKRSGTCLYTVNEDGNQTYSPTIDNLAMRQNY
ncbi:hypothetical protein FGO68_gene806 [Halteria grandinella]|uniref:Uncharacterized protein n=1 Tax=Halteria grandinella TaxID=5974 RepID=A0A8J8SVQ0_HALGN|nr:hypothetical protein FGO68_gene806 [Halteria grandinella]